MPLFGNNEGAGKAGLFHRCCLGTGKATTTWQNEWQLCTISTAICSSNKKNKKSGVYGLKKQTNKKPLCNCWSIIRGKRRRAELHTNAQSLRLTQLQCQDMYCLQHSASGLQCTCSQHKHCSHQGTCKAQQHWPGMAGGQELPKGLANDSMWKSKCTPSMYQNTGIWGSSHAGVGTWLFLAIPARWVLEITSPASCRQGEDTIFTQPLTTLTKINGSKTWGQPSSWFFSLPVLPQEHLRQRRPSEKSRPQEIEAITWPEVKDQDLLAFSFSTLLSLTLRKTLS